MSSPRLRALSLVSVAMIAAGCGSGNSHRSGAAKQTTSTRTQPSSPQPSSPAPGGTITLPAPGPTGIAVAPAAVRVIRAWADALRHGDVRGAARYFALPSVMINGGGTGGLVSVIRIHTIADAEAANAGLPCGARFLSADKRGQYVNVLFMLTGRPGPGGGNCGGGAGATARTNFVVIGGRIRAWLRAPDDPGDGQQQSGPAA
jgi:hypothetical protein